MIQMCTILRTRTKESPGYPPFGHLFTIGISGKNRDKVNKVAAEMANKPKRISQFGIRTGTRSQMAGQGDVPVQDSHKR